MQNLYRNPQQRSQGIEITGGGHIRLHLIVQRLIVLPGGHPVSQRAGAVDTALTGMILPVSLTIVPRLGRYAELLHHAGGDTDIGQAMLPLDPDVHILRAQAGRDEQSAEELAAVLDLHGDIRFAKAAAPKGKGEMPLLSLTGDFAAQILQGGQQRGHGTPAHLGGGVQMVDAPGYPQVSG